MTKYNQYKLILILVSLVVIPLTIWLRYIFGEPQAVWLVNLIFGLQ